MEEYINYFYEEDERIERLLRNSGNLNQMDNLFEDMNIEKKEANLNLKFNHGERESLLHEQFYIQDYGNDEKAKLLTEPYHFDLRFRMELLKFKNFSKIKSTKRKLYLQKGL